MEPNRAVAFLADREGRPLAALLLLLVVLVYLLWGDSLWGGVRNTVFDAYQKACPRKVTHLPAVIVDIDETSLKELGQWPWPRTRLASLIRAAIEGGAAVVGLDFIMPEADRLSPDIFARERPDIGPGLRKSLSSLPSNDDLLAETLSKAPVVVGRAGLEAIDAPKTDSVPHTAVVVREDVSLSPLKHYAGHLTNLPVVEKAARGRGYLNDLRDADGVVRRVPLVFVVEGQPVPSLALELFRVASGEEWFTLLGGPRGLIGAALGSVFIPTDLEGRVRLYYSDEDPRRRISAVKIYRGQAEPETLAGKAAIIGVSALGLMDTAPTPLNPLMEGTEIHVQIVENIYSSAYLTRPGRARVFEALALIAGPLCLILFGPRLGARGMAGSSLVWALGLITAGVLGFTRLRVLWDPSAPLAACALILAALVLSRYANVEIKRRRLKAALEEERIRGIRLEGELEAARAIQMGILPDPASIEGLPENLEVHAVLEPAGMVGGDLYDALMMDPQRFFFMIGDVSGKGIPASLFMALSKTLTKSAALRGHPSLGELMVRANQEISRDNPEQLFVTTTACILDVTTGQMDYCIAGHGSPILLSEGRGPMALESEGGPPLCTLKDFPYPVSSYRLVPGDLIVLITDGVTEAHNQGGGVYGNERVLRYLSGLGWQDGKGPSAESVCQGLFEDVKEFCQANTPFDDIAIMAVRFRGPAPA